MRRRRIRPGTLLFPQNTTESAPSVTRSGAAPPPLAAPPSAGTARDFWRVPLNIGTARDSWRIEPYDSAESSQMGRIATCHENLPKWDDVVAST